MVFLLIILITVIVLIIYAVSWLYDKLSNPIEFDFDSSNNQLIIIDNIRNQKKVIKFPVPTFEFVKGKLSVLVNNEVVQELGVFPEDNLIEFDEYNGNLTVRNIHGDIVKRVNLAFKPPRVDVAGDVITITDSVGKKHVIDLLGKLPYIEIVGTKLMVKDHKGNEKNSFDIMRLAPEPNVFFMREKYLYTKNIKNGTEARIFDLNKLIPIMSVENRKLYTQVGDIKKLLFDFNLLEGFSPIVFIKDDKIMVTLPDGTDQMLFDMQQVFDKVPIIKMMGSKLMINDEVVINFNDYVPILVVENSVLRVLYPDGTSKDLFDLMLLKRAPIKFATDGVKIFSTQKESDGSNKTSEVFDFTDIYSSIGVNTNNVKNNVNKINNEVDRINSLFVSITGINNTNKIQNDKLANLVKMVDSIVVVNESQDSANETNKNKIVDVVNVNNRQQNTLTENRELIDGQIGRLNYEVGQIRGAHDRISNEVGRLNGVIDVNKNQDVSINATKSKINEVINKLNELAHKTNSLRHYTRNTFDFIHNNRNMSGHISLPAGLPRISIDGDDRIELRGFGQQLTEVGNVSINTTNISHV